MCEELNTLQEQSATYRRIAGKKALVYTRKNEGEEVGVEEKR
jgi:hypothetical protein